VTPREHKLTTKNVAQWKGRIAKLEDKGDISSDEQEEMDMRKAQVGIWEYQLKHGTGSAAVAGDMSASSEVKTSESAGGT